MAAPEQSSWSAWLCKSDTCQEWGAQRAPTPDLVVFLR